MSPLRSHNLYPIWNALLLSKQPGVRIKVGPFAKEIICQFAKKERISKTYGEQVTYQTSKEKLGCEMRRFAVI